MKFTTKDLDWAAETGVISRDMCEALQTALEKRYEHRPSLTFANVLYYLGGLIIIAAMTLYITLAWADLGGLGHLVIALACASLFVLIGNWLWHSKGLRIPGGVLITAAVCMTPMAAFGVQEMSGWWVMGSPGVYRDFYQWIRSGWAIMEVATIVTGLAALRFYKFPFIAMPVAFSLWFLSMDLVAMLYGAGFLWEHRFHVSLWFGLFMLIAAYAVDHKTREDFAFWGYLFGMIAFWGGLTNLDSNSELGKFGYCMINVVLMAVSVLLQRRIFILFGAMGVTLYIGHLTQQFFKKELLFSFALSVIGLLIIGFGVLYNKYEKRIEQWMIGVLPEVVRKTLPQYRK